MREQEPHSRRYSRVLLILLFLFCLRVIGQMLVAFLHVSFLPPMKEWFSGLLPYPELVVSQSLIILLFSKVYLDFHRGAGYFVKLSPRFSRNLMIFGCVYFSGMIVRYVLRMSLYPDQRLVRRHNSDHFSLCPCIVYPGHGSLQSQKCELGER